MTESSKANKQANDNQSRGRRLYQRESRYGLSIMKDLIRRRR